MAKFAHIQDETREVDSESFDDGSGDPLFDIFHVGCPRIDLSIPTVLDSATGEEVDPGLWGEIQLCWDRVLGALERIDARF